MLYRSIKNEIRTFIFILSILLCAALMLTGCSGSSENRNSDARDLPVINVGCDNYAPFSYINADGEFTGIDVELATEAFDRLGYKAEFTIINWEDKKLLLHSGVIDCIWSSFTMDGREDEYRWAGPYMKSEQVIAVNENSDIYTMSDLEGKLIAVQSSTKPEDIIREHGEGIPDFRKVISVKKRDLIFTMLGKGYVDAASAHITAVEQFMRDSGMKFRVLDEPLLTVGLGAAFDNDDDRGIDTELSEVMKQMNSDGTTARIIGKYMSDPERFLEDEK